MSARSLTLEQLSRLCHDGEWRRGLHAAAPSGFAELDANLPGGGWPVGAICELLLETMGIGELGLLVPALARLVQAGRYIAWIAPPYLPYAPALAQAGLALKQVLVVQTRSLQESLWATEQTLRCPAFGAVLSWPSGIADKNVRRLQLAAEAGGSLGVLYRPAEAAREHSPAALRLCLEPTDSGLTINIHKCRGGRPGARLQLRTDAIAMG
jgi:protein ImuA